MTVGQLLEKIESSCMIRIRKNGEDAFCGYLGTLRLEAEDRKDEGLAKLIEEEVQHFAAVPEIRHRQWKDKGLIQPLLPEATPTYLFSDLQMTLYYTITL